MKIKVCFGLWKRKHISFLTKYFMKSCSFYKKLSHTECCSFVSTQFFCVLYCFHTYTLWRILLLSSFPAACSTAHSWPLCIFLSFWQSLSLVLWYVREIAITFDQSVLLSVVERSTDIPYISDSEATWNIYGRVPL